uniref:NADH dehydrogenase subunit 2 n=2 Tax=Pristionchus pacificus TaxID=54126 RepID=F2YQ30_PRIPA|nr:NADH dehydrogenase subunit 2 [Pristionchus pacificus]ADZ52292.1 NADH dehydrogenase subunit 2 [Pristionchus pacificus]
MMIFMISFVLFLSLLSLMTNNMIIWWSVFLMMTVVFIFLNKNVKSYSSLINYFVIQESLGLMFLLMNFGIFQFFIIMMKIGVAPLHFWIFSITNNIFSYNLMWFLTFQKLPFLLILVQIFWLGGLMLLFFGLMVCYLQMFSLKNYKNLLVLSSTESFNWIIMGVFMSLINSVYLFIYYMILMVMLINKFSKSSSNWLNWETILVFLNMPFSVTFFVKIFSLSEIFKFNTIMMLVMLMMMFLSALTFSYWLINMSVKFYDKNQMNNNYFYFLLYPLMLISII